MSVTAPHIMPCDTSLTMLCLATPHLTGLQPSSPYTSRKPDWDFLRSPLNSVLLDIFWLTLACLVHGGYYSPGYLFLTCYHYALYICCTLRTVSAPRSKPHLPPLLKRAFRPQSSVFRVAYWFTHLLVLTMSSHLPPHYVIQWSFRKAVVRQKSGHALS